MLHYLFFLILCCMFCSGSAENPSDETQGEIRKDLFAMLSNPGYIRVVRDRSVIMAQHVIFSGNVHHDCIPELQLYMDRYGEY